MKNPQIAYRLNSSTKRFLEKAEEEGFYFEKIPYNGGNSRAYAIMKKIDSAEGQSKIEKIFGHIFGKDLIINFLPAYEGIYANHKPEVEQLKKLAKKYCNSPIGSLWQEED